MQSAEPDPAGLYKYSFEFFVALSFLRLHDQLPGDVETRDPLQN